MGTLMPGESRTVEIEVAIPFPSRPLYTHPASETWHTKSQYHPLFDLRAEVGFGGAKDKTFLSPAVPVDAELRRAIEIEVDPPDVAAILGAGKPVELTVRVRNNTQSDIDGLQVGFLDPFSGKPMKSQMMQLPGNGGQAIAAGMLMKPRKTSLPGVYPVRIECKLEPQVNLPDPKLLTPEPVEARVHLLSVKTAPKLKVGLIETYDDAHAQALRVLGVDFERIDSAMLRGGDLNRFDTILLSLRAYHDREDVARHNDRLLDYVEQSGNLVCTYNKTFEWNREDGINYAPFPIVLGRDRVTREEAPMTILDPQHPQFNFPNRVSHGDLEGWFQERCLYFPAQWDRRYEELIECHDPGDSDHRGGHLTARFGEGTYTYTCFVWYRQLRRFNPGAYKMFANMISQAKLPNAESSNEEFRMRNSE